MQVERTRPLALAALALLMAGCGDNGDLPVRAPSVRVGEGHPQSDQLWPALLRHCLRNPSCDPMSAFSVGAGQASGAAVYTSWFAERADTLEDGAQFGSRIRLSLSAYRGEGGEAGRPLATSERDANLRAFRDGQSRLTIEYRTVGDTPTPYFASMRTRQLVLAVPGLTDGDTRDEVVAKTQAVVAGWVWPDAGRGARVELSVDGKALFSGYSLGAASRTVWRDEEVEALAFEPWVFSLSSAMSEVANGAQLISVLKSRRRIELTVRAPNGDLIFRDTFTAGGHEDAMEEALAALDDPSIATPLTERCAPYVDWDNDDWARAGVTMAQSTCDPLTPDARRRILESSAPI